MKIAHEIRFMVAICLVGILVTSCFDEKEHIPITFSPSPSFVPGVTSLPVMYIEMSKDDCDSIHATRNWKSDAFCVIVSSDDKDTLYDGDISIKSRGHRSWDRSSKKPYAIQFPKRIKLFDLYEGKKFILLTNFQEPSHIRNAIALDMGRRFGLAAPKYEYLRLYVNGDYRGLYQMTNKIEPNKSFLYITNLEKENKRINGSSLKKYSIERRGEFTARDLPLCPTDISGGYIVDHHAPRNEECGFVSYSGRIIRVKSPEHASFEEVEYIASIYNQIERALLAPNGVDPLTRKHYSDLIDISSFVKNYIINEILKNCDAGVGSFMLSKDIDSIDGKVYASPIWDFDGYRPGFSNELFACAKFDIKEGRRVGLLNMLWQHEEFQKQVRHLYVTEFYPYMDSLLMNKNDDGKWDYHVRTRIAAETRNDNLRWNRGVDLCDYETDLLYTFLSERIKFLYWLWTTDPEDVLCMKLERTDESRTTYIYASKDSGLHLHPQFGINSGTDVKYYLSGTDIVIPNDTVFFQNVDVTYVRKSLTWYEIQKRKLFRYMKKFF